MSQRSIAKIDKVIMNNFYKLVHTEAHIRLTAAISTFKVLNCLKKNQTDKFNDNLNYCVDRLVAGLSSNRACARQGYGTLLMEVLSKFKVSTDRLLTLAHQKYGHINKDTTRDNLLAYFMLIAMILQSENYKHYPKCLEKLYKQLIQLTYTKSYFEYPVSKLLVQYRELFYTHMLDSIPEHAFEMDGKLMSQQLLTIALCHQTKPMKNLTSMDKGRLNYFFSLLVHEKFQKHPLHPIFIEMTRVVVENFSDHFESFYNTVILAQFFKVNHNELASMGLEYTLEFISNFHYSDGINTVLNEHVIRLLILSLRKRTPLSKHCSEFFSSLVKVFKKTSEEAKDSQSQAHFLQFNILQKLTSSPGSITFDEDSKSKSISSLLQESSPNVLRKYLERLMLSFNKQTNQEREHIQLSIARQLAFIINRPQMADDTASMSKLAKFLLLNSMFYVKEEKICSKKEEEFWSSQGLPKPLRNIKDSIRSAVKTAYNSSMDHLVSVCNINQKNELMNDLIEFSNSLISSNYVSHSSTFNEDSNDKENVQELWSVYMTNLSKYRAHIAKSNDSKLLQPITSLFLFYGLQVIQHELDCKSQLEELIQSAEEAVKDDPNDGSWADILTDQIIAILSATECSSWIRRLSESIFGSLLPHISQTSIDVLCEALLEENHDDCDGESEQDEKEDDSDDDSTYSDSSDYEDISDSEKIEPEDIDDEAVDRESDDIHKDGNNTDSEVNMDAGNEEENSITNSNEDEDVKSSEEEYLDDEQMMKLDPVLADMFRLNRIGKKGSSSFAFKLRCLDLVKKIVMKKSNDSETIETILDCIIPLAKSSKKNVDARPIHDKVVHLLNKMPGKNKYDKVTEFLSSKTIKNTKQ